MPAHHKTKRKRGGQKGNQNARKHGLYSPTLTASEINEIRNIVSLEGIDPEIAQVRLKLQSFLRNDPGNPRVLAQAARLLARWCCVKYQLDRSERPHLEALIKSVLCVGLLLHPFSPNNQLTNNPDPNE